ncbi:hypothetical protein DXZ75_08735 [Streptomyces sp. AcE210]|nr:hypothetical protein DXZ75_08735 [Streptomyces sp. AcE210]
MPAADRVRIARTPTELRHVCAAVLVKVRPELTEAEGRSLFAAAQEALLIRHADPTPSTEAVADLLVRLFPLPERSLGTGQFSN